MPRQNAGRQFSCCDASAADGSENSLTWCEHVRSDRTYVPKWMMPTPKGPIGSVWTGEAWYHRRVADGRTKIFISWSGEYTERIALIWQRLVLDMFDMVEVFVSSSSIDPGARPLEQIKNELDGTSLGIVVVTPQNQDAAWLNYEAGALSRTVPEAVTRVMPSLVGFDSPAQVTSPLKQFQSQKLNTEGVVKILQEIAKVNGIEWLRKQATFERAWSVYEPEFEKAIRSKAQAVQTVKRSSEDMVDEVLTIVRELQNRWPSPMVRRNSGDSDPMEPDSAALKSMIGNYIQALGKRYSELQIGKSEAGQFVAHVRLARNQTAKEALQLNTALSREFRNVDFRVGVSGDPRR